MLLLFIVYSPSIVVNMLTVIVPIPPSIYPGVTMAMSICCAAVDEMRVGVRVSRTLPGCNRYVFHCGECRGNRVILSHEEEVPAHSGTGFLYLRIEDSGRDR